MVTDNIPFTKDDIAMLSQIPFNPNIGVRNIAKGIRINVKIMEMADGILGKPIPV